MAAGHISAMAREKLTMWKADTNLMMIFFKKKLGSLNQHNSTIWGGGGGIYTLVITVRGTSKTLITCSVWIDGYQTQ